MTRPFLKLLDQYLQRPTPVFGNCQAAAVYAALDHKDDAFKFLEKAYEEDDFPVFRVKVDPLFDPLRSSDLLRRLVLTP